ncbi:MAG: HAD family hydrolase [Rhodothermus sp.]|nr:HAD family hydrolase [Rhodothermus sp.]
MIRLFVSDIDGCLAEPYRPFALDRFQALADLIRQAGRPGDHPSLPAFSICSGRPYPYVEAVTQVLGVQVPVLFEAGAGMFDPRAAVVRWHPNFTDELAEQVEALRRWMVAHCIPGTSLMLDIGKRTQAGMVGPNPEEILRLVPVVEEYVAAHFPAFHVFHTHISIDVVPRGFTKREGLQWLMETLGLISEEVAYIGDANGDLGALELVGYAFAPANATATVRQQVSFVMEERTIEGVLAAYRWCVHHNKQDQQKRVAS